MSPLLNFHFWELVIFNTDGTSFPSDAPEERGRFVGISENFGHDVTFKILDSSTNKTINRFDIRPIDDDKSPNLRDNPLTSPEVINSLRKDKFKAEEDPHDYEPSSYERSLPSSSKSSIPEVDTNDLVERTFLLEKECGQCLRARIVKTLEDLKAI